MNKKLVTACASLVVLFVSGAALAEEGDTFVTQDERDGYSVKFRDDLLDAKGIDAGGPMFVMRPRAIRVTLIRPRTSFVNEMLKSVENL